MKRRALVLMTALLPTKGHKNLILYARMLADEVDVLICTRSFEPIGMVEREQSFKREFLNMTGINIITYENDNAPQNPEDCQDFWEVWRDIILNNTNIKSGDMIVGSEQYGYDLARVLECKYYPYDIQREILNIKGTSVRNNIVERFDDILPSFQRYLGSTITIYGAESCGKTTTGKYLVNHLLNGYFLPEWARPYLESLGNPQVTEELMDDITEGQMALQMHRYYALTDKPFIIQDTDLLSTIGYYKIMGIDVPKKIIDYFDWSKSDLYCLMASNIPFEADPLRYGGDVRESTDEFWIDLLKEYGCNYIIVNQETLEERAGFIKAELDSFIEKKFSSIKEFVRE